jgi:hypothetical protein
LPAEGVAGDVTDGVDVGRSLDAGVPGDGQRNPFSGKGELRQAGPTVSWMIGYAKTPRVAIINSPPPKSSSP